MIYIILGIGSGSGSGRGRKQERILLNKFKLRINKKIERKYQGIGLKTWVIIYLLKEKD